MSEETSWLGALGKTPIHSSAMSVTSRQLSTPQEMSHRRSHFTPSATQTRCSCVLIGSLHCMLASLSAYPIALYPGLQAHAPRGCVTLGSGKMQVGAVERSQVLEWGLQAFGQIESTTERFSNPGYWGRLPSRQRGKVPSRQYSRDTTS